MMAAESGRESTPFAGSDDDWEDHLDNPRSAADLVDALETTWQIVAGALDSWTEPMLREKFERGWAGAVGHHSRASIMTRLATHDGFPVGEISAILGSHGRPGMDRWDRPNPDVDPDWRGVGRTTCRQAGTARRPPRRRAISVGVEVLAGRHGPA